MSEPSIVLICGDLMFQAKVQDTARHFKVAVHVARNEGDVLSKVLMYKPALVLLDLSFEGVHPLKIVEKLKSDPKLKQYKVLAFGPHVERDLFAAAKHAGCDEVMARSMFSASLAKIMANLVETSSMGQIRPQQVSDEDLP
ncbi:MAG TPA: hypothetical protein VJH22_01820 [Candidatus Nanoarchaeia archaeon]|nr:hypothetical protein [Candidatus Nanoarchaeia archaeon]